MTIKFIRSDPGDPRRTHSFSLRHLSVIFSAAIGAFLTGCKDNPGKWDDSEIGAHMEEVTKMKIEVTGHDDGRVTATGIDSKGRTFTFAIERDPKRKEVKWTSFDSNGKLLKVHTSREP